MNIDLLPFSAFASDASRAVSRPFGQGNTLTLRLDLTPVHPAFNAMSGSIDFEDASSDRAPGLRAAVIPCEGPGLTITF